MWSAAALTPLFQTCFFDLRMRRLAGDLALLFALESLLRLVVPVSIRYWPL